MRSSARIVLLVLLFAALPLRAVASVFCSAAGHDLPAQMHAHGHETGDHTGAHPGENPSGALGHDCGFCVEHCCSAALLLPERALRVAAEGSAVPIPFGTRPISGFVPEHPERPPLPL